MLLLLYCVFDCVVVSQMMLSQVRLKAITSTGGIKFLCFVAFAFTTETGGANKIRITAAS